MERTLEYGNIKLEWMGHATFLIRNGKNIYIDPFVLSSSPPKADIILVTHDHYDHCDPKAISQIATENTIILGPPQAIQKLEGIVPASRLEQITPGQQKDIEGILIEAVHAYNPEKPFHPQGSGVGYIIEYEGARIYHAGDTDITPEMADLEQKQIDIALLPIGGKYTMDTKEAAKAAAAISPRIAIPMHYNHLPETQADPQEFLEQVQEENPGVKVVILQPTGE